MSDDDQQQLPCADKVTFDTKSEANAAGMAADWQHGSKLRAYRCKFCQLWHLTTRYEDD